MRIHDTTRPRLLSLLAALVFTLALGGFAHAQGDGARAYWKTLDGTNAVSFWPIHMSGNANPLDPSHRVVPDAEFEANLAIAGYSRMVHMLGRSAMASVLVPVGNLKADVTGVPLGVQSSSSGFGDPLLQVDLNLVGAPAIRDLKGLLRYEPKITVDLLASLALPIGEHDPASSLNLGQNRWYGRLGAPMMVALAPWVPGRRTTLELLPAVWLFGENDEFHGQTLATDPLLQLEAHVTRDLTESLWASLDLVWLSGGAPEVSGEPGDDVDNLGLGFTFGIKVNDNLFLQPSYLSSIGDGDPGDLRRDEFRFAVNYGWHPLIEGMKRLSKH